MRSNPFHKFQRLRSARARARRSPEPGELALALLGGMALGVASAWLVDPYRGRERRHRILEQVRHAWHRTQTTSRATGRDLYQRARGYAARARGLVRHDAVNDAVLEERIRSDLGRLVSHPHAIEVHANDGHVTLAGPVLSTEVQRLVRRVKRAHGVGQLVNRLEVHTSEDVPALRGRSASPGATGWLRASWPPATRLLVGTGGLAAWLAGSAGRPTGRTALCTLGALGLWRSLVNEPVHGGRRRRARSEREHAEASR